MVCPAVLMDVWRQFDGVPMETLSKAWLIAREGRGRQRSVAEMAADRGRWGTGGNCFDLAIWLALSLEAAGVPAAVIGHDLETARAHVATLACLDGTSYLCDLGDQWLEPVAISGGLAGQWIEGAFPGAEVQLTVTDRRLVVAYLFPDGRQSSQAPLAPAALERACAHSQGLLRKAQVEVRTREREPSVWEYQPERAFWRLPTGQRDDPTGATVEGQAERIAKRTGIDVGLARVALRIYRDHGVPST